MVRGRVRGGRGVRRVRWRRGGGVEGDGARGGAASACGDVRDDGGESGRGGERRRAGERETGALDGCPRTAREVSARASRGGVRGHVGGAIPSRWIGTERGSDGR